MTRIKICGLTRAEDVDAAVDAGADFLGFNFWRGSPRRLEPADAKKLVDRVRRGAIPVGVFVHAQPWDPVVCEYAGVAWAQIHGAPASWLPERYARPVIRAVPVAGPVDASVLTGGDYWIVDTAQKGHGGGGVSFAWSHAQALAGHPRVFLAGGLTPENVAAAVKQLRPYAVDVASGVESAPGKKDAGKVRAFVEAVRAADKELVHEGSTG